MDIDGAGVAIKQVINKNNSTQSRCLVANALIKKYIYFQIIFLMINGYRWRWSRNNEQR